MEKKQDHIRQALRYQELLKQAKNLSQPPPQGWGRTVVSGNTIITPPSNISPLKESMNQEAINVQSQPKQIKPDLSFPQFNSPQTSIEEYSSRPNSKKEEWIGEYHIDDLQKQYDELKSNFTDKELNTMVGDKYNPMNKFLMETGNPKDKKYAEDAKFLGTAIEFGRAKE